MFGHLAHNILDHICLFIFHYLGLRSAYFKSIHTFYYFLLCLVNAGLDERFWAPNIRSRLPSLLRLKTGIYTQNVAYFKKTGLSTYKLINFTHKLKPTFSLILSNCICACICRLLQCVSKKHPRHFSCNFRKHCRILIMFGTPVTEKVSNQ